MGSYHPDFYRKNVGELGKEVRSILRSKRYDPFAKFLGIIMEKGMWSRIKEKAGDVEPAKLLKLFRAYRTGELKKHTITMKTYHSGERRLREETLTMEEYLRRLSSTVRLPQQAGIEKLSEIIQNLHVLVEAIEREECKEGCNITVSPYPEFFYDEKKDRFRYLPSTAFSALEEAGIPAKYILSANPNLALNFLKLDHNKILGRIRFYEKELGLTFNDILQAHPSTALSFLTLNPNTVLQHLKFYESLGLPLDYILQTNPNTALSFLKFDPETVRRRLEKLAKQLGVTVKDLPKIYAPNTLLRYIMGRGKT